MKKPIANIEYTEEDGFVIRRGDTEYCVYGEAEAAYERDYTSGTRWEPKKDEVKRAYEMSVDVTTITDMDGNDVDIVLTDAERSLFEDHMSTKLDEAAEEYDDWNDDSWDYEEE